QAEDGIRVDLVTGVQTCALPISVRILLQRGLELAERRGGLALLQEKLAEQLAHRVKPVLHRHVLDAAVLAVGRGAHELQRLVGRSEERRGGSECGSRRRRVESTM